MKTLFALFPALLLLASCAGTSGLSARTDPPPPPSALLVLLPYSTQRINLLHARGDHATAQRLATAQADMRRRMVADFNDNYWYGPYYFAADSNVEQLTAGAWNGLLLDAALRPVTAVPLAPQDSSVLFVYQGYRSRESHTRNLESTGAYEETNQGLEAIYQTLVLCDRNLRQLPRNLPRRKGARPAPPPSAPAVAKPGYVYYYRQREFNLSYNAQADALSNRMNRYFRPAPNR